MSHLLGSGLSCLIPKTFELCHGCSQYHSYHCETISSLLGQAPVSYRGQRDGSRAGGIAGRCWGLWTMHWKERRGSTARFWTPLLEVEKRPMYCQENQKSLLLTCTFISSIRVWAILLLTQVFAALGLGLAYGSMHSFVLAQGASPTLPACFLPPTNRRADCTIYNSLWNQLFRCQVEGKAEGN